MGPSIRVCCMQGDKPDHWGIVHVIDQAQATLLVSHLLRLPHAKLAAILVQEQQADGAWLTVAGVWP